MRVLTSHNLKFFYFDYLVKRVERCAATEAISSMSEHEFHVIHVGNIYIVGAVRSCGEYA